MAADGRRSGTGGHGGAAARLAMVLLLALPGCTVFEKAPGTFYDATAAEVRGGPPGSIIRAEPMAEAPAEAAEAWRVLYRSTGFDGRPVAVSGVVVVPRAPAPAGAPSEASSGAPSGAPAGPASGGRPVVAWAHPTTGVARACAPSLYRSVFRNTAGLRDMLRRGWVVVATDYHGLGTAGPHAYLSGPGAAHAVLDSVRAARALPGSGAGARFVAWGHSQGGHAVLWTALTARRYAPELRPVGYAAAAPATDLGETFELIRGEFAWRVLTAMTLWSWDRAFGYSTETLVDPRARRNYREVARTCSAAYASRIEGYLAQRRLARHFLMADPTKVEPWKSHIARNSPVPARLGAPVFLAQGLADTTILPRVTLAYARALCRSGNRVRLYGMKDVDHSMIAMRSANVAVAWMAERFAGRRAPDACGRREN